MLKAKAVQLAGAAKEASASLARASSAIKNGALLRAAELLKKNAKAIFAANAKDLKAGKKAGLSKAMLDRLAITPKGLEHMCEGLRQVAALPDPVGETIKGWKRPNGLSLRRVRVPLGVIFMIYESRPNVTIDAAALAIKSGNAVILRGGKEAINSNLALGKVLAQAISEMGLPPEVAQVVDITDRALVAEMLHLGQYIDVVIPRGGKGLVKTIADESEIPVIMHLDGICHVFVDATADLAMAEAIAVNAKAQRPGTCNAMETLLVHEEIASAFLPRGLKALAKAGVELRGCARTRAIAQSAKLKGITIKPATEEDWATEYLDLILSIKVVKNIDEAIRHIATYSSRHTEAIVTRDVFSAERFRTEVDSASVMVNASTRLADGFEYGLGAEMGISTNKLHARGPVGLEELTTYKYLVDGEGHLRS